MWGEQGLCVCTGVDVCDGSVYQGDESSASAADSVLPNGGEVMECGCFMCSV